MPSTTFKLRKLCSPAEEYEANASGPLDLDLLAQRISRRPGVELSRCDSILTILFEDERVVVRVYPSGRALIQAVLREDADRVCLILAGACSSNNEDHWLE